MKHRNRKPLTEITSEAIKIVVEHIGVANTLRFLNQFSNGAGDYTKEREKLFGDATLDGLVRRIKEVRS